MKVCRSCEKPLPNRVKVNGVIKNIGGRKYCLECSPWGQHNTKQLHNGPGSIYPARSKEYNHEKYLQNKDKLNADSKKRLRAINDKRRLDLIQLKGGACQKCGYNKCRAALELHHRDKTEKLFNLSGSKFRFRPWDEILIELDKCDLMCANCHRESHHNNVNSF